MLILSGLKEALLTSGQRFLGDSGYYSAMCVVPDSLKPAPWNNKQKCLRSVVERVMGCVMSYGVASGVFHASPELHSLALMCVYHCVEHALAPCAGVTRKQFNFISKNVDKVRVRVATPGVSFQPRKSAIKPHWSFACSGILSTADTCPWQLAKITNLRGYAIDSFAQNCKHEVHIFFLQKSENYLLHQFC